MSYALRGATTVEIDSPAAVDEAVKELFEKLLEVNHLKEEELVFVLFSQTADIRTRNAAAALRKAGYCEHIPLFCVQEAEINGMMHFVIRVLIEVNHEPIEGPEMVYLRRAEELRHDLVRA